MNISRIYINKNTFKADSKTKDPHTGHYKDPLMRWPLRGAAFTNEVGEALRPLIGGYATLSWVPALLYIGADIYDKFKNDKTDYSPDSRRCLKQAIFQGMASIFLPLVAVNLGQYVFSLAGLTTKDKLSVNSKENINKLAQEFVANGKMRAYHGKDDECVKEFLEIVSDNLDFKKQEYSTKNPIKKIFYHIEEAITQKIKANTPEHVEEEARKIMTSLIDMRKQLLEPTDKFKKSKYYYYYNGSMKKGQTKNVAIKSVLKKCLQNKTIKGRTIKTIGGFLALGVAIKPIDNFVEHVLIGKIVGPGIDKTKRTV